MAFQPNACTLFPVEDIVRRNQFVFEDSSQNKYRNSRNHKHDGRQTGNPQVSEHQRVGTHTFDEKTGYSIPGQINRQPITQIKFSGKSSRYHHDQKAEEIGNRFEIEGWIIISGNRLDIESAEIGDIHLVDDKVRHQQPMQSFPLRNQLGIGSGPVV